MLQLCVACSLFLQISFSILKSELSLKNLGDLAMVGRLLHQAKGLETCCPFPAGLSTLPPVARMALRVVKETFLWVSNALSFPLEIFLINARTSLAPCGYDHES